MLMSNDRMPAAHYERTSDMFLLGGSFLGIGGFLDVHHQLSLGLVFVHWPGWVVNFVAVYVISRLPGSLAREPIVILLEYT